MQTLSNNLSRYDYTRMVVMKSSASVYEAARALDANHIGCVIVADDDRVVGILTDRDLAVRVIGYELDPRELILKDVMTPHVATVPAGATEADAAEIMLERHVRRVPIEQSGNIVGMVTLDDLIIHGFDPTVVACIVEAQLADRALLKEAGDVHPMSPTREPPDAPSRAERADRRHAAHARTTYDRLLRRVMAETGLPIKESAETALEVVLAAVIERLTPEASAEMLAQLPVILREHLSAVPRGPNRGVTRDGVERVLALRLGVSEARATELAVEVGRTVGEALSHGELHDMKAELSRDLRSLLP